MGPDDILTQARGLAATVLSERAFRMRGGQDDCYTDNARSRGREHVAMEQLLALLAEPATTAPGCQTCYGVGYIGGEDLVGAQPPVPCPVCRPTTAADQPREAAESYWVADTLNAMVRQEGEAWRISANMMFHELRRRIAALEERMDHNKRVLADLVAALEAQKRGGGE